MVQAGFLHCQTELAMPVWVSGAMLMLANSCPMAHVTGHGLPGCYSLLLESWMDSMATRPGVGSLCAAAWVLNIKLCRSQWF